MLSEKQQIELEQAINEYCNTNKSARQIAKKYGFSKDRITNTLNARGIMREKKDNSFNEDYFSVIDSEEKAYWLGFIYADGCVLDKSNCLEIDLQASDIGQLNKFKASVLFKGDIKIKTNILKGKTYGACRIRLFSGKLKSDLIKLGCTPRKSLTIKYPNIDPKYNNHFIRGYFDGDGSVYSYLKSGKETPCISIIGTFEFLSKVQNIFIDEANLREVKLYNQKVTVWEYKKAHNQALKVLHYLYDGSSIYLDRKFEKFMESARGSKIGRS
jgi:hypothetical protein